MPAKDIFKKYRSPASADPGLDLEVPAEEEDEASALEQAMAVERAPAEPNSPLPKSENDAAEVAPASGEMNSTMASALLALVPTVLGSVLGGRKGGAAGAKRGMAAVEKYDATVAAREKIEREEEKQHKDREARLAEREARERGVDRRHAETIEAGLDKAKIASAATVTTKEGDRNFQREMKELDRKAKDRKKGGDGADKLAPEDRQFVGALRTKQANKVSISNQLAANVGDWDSLSTDAKLDRGRLMLKILNSAEGQDAVGAEEAKRLGQRLEFAYGNLTNDNPIRIGRDLEGFKEQVLQTVKAMRAGIAENEKAVSKVTGRKSKLISDKKETPPPERKTIDGKTYTKVPGGWRLEE